MSIWNRKKNGFTAQANNMIVRIKEVLATKDRTTPKKYFRLSVCSPNGVWTHIKTKGKDFTTLLGAKNRGQKYLA